MSDPESAPTIDILIIGSMFYSGHQLTDQRLARAFADLGKVVCYVDLPAIPFRGSRGGAQGQSAKVGSSQSDGMWVFTPTGIPFRRMAGLAVVNATLVVFQILVFLGRYLRRDTAIVIFAANPTMLLWLRRWQRIVVVKDDYVAGTGLIGQKAHIVRRRRRRSLSRASLIITVSVSLKASLLKEGFLATVVGPGANVPDAVALEPDDLAGVPRPRALFSGLVSERIDLLLLNAVADAGWELVLVGGTQRTFHSFDQFNALTSRANVHQFGWRTPEELQGIAQWCDVGLLPYTLSDFNLASSPLKTLEYLAAGLAVLSTALPNVLALDSPDVDIVDSPDALRSRLDDLRKNPSTDDDRSRRIELALAHSWSSRAQTYLDLMAERS